MVLKNHLLEKQNTIVDRWFKSILTTYPKDTAKFLGGDGDRFQNPVGKTIAPAIEAIFTTLVNGEGVDVMRPHLDAIIRIRAVQDFSAAGAVGFIFQLKQIVRDEVGGRAEYQADLLALEDRVDLAALLAFDIYMGCKEKIYAIKADSIQRRTAAFLRRHNYVVGDPEPELMADPAHQSDCGTSCGSDCSPTTISNPEATE